MTPYAKKYILDEEVVLFEKVRLAVIHMPDIDLGIDEKGNPIILSCHMLARAVAKTFSVEYVDGYFLHMDSEYFKFHRGYEHSWIVTPHSNIIDVYPIVVLGGPIMMEGDNLIARQLYSPNSTRKISQGRFGKNSFKRAVRRTISALEQ